MKKKKIILLSGKSGVGKDTLANILISKLNHNKAKRIAFADVPKELCANILNVDVSYFHDRKIKDSFIPNMKLTYREFLINLAEGIRKSFGNDFWAKMCLEKETNVKDIEYYIVSDLRLLDELHKVYEFCNINNFDCVSIRINNSLLKSESEHITEVNLDNYPDWDFIVDNSSTIQWLMDTADDITNKINF